MSGLRTERLGQRLDLDENGSLSLNEINLGLKKLKLPRPIHLTHEDFDMLTMDRTLLDEDGELTPQAFEQMMLAELDGYVRRKVCSLALSCAAVAA